MKTVLVDKINLDAESRIYKEKVNLYYPAYRNNKRRGFLFVSPFLGKHIPTRVSKLMFMGRLLAAKIKHSLIPESVCECFNQDVSNYEFPKPYLGKNVCVCGMGETATGLGYAVAKSIPNAKFTYTTRQSLEPGITYLGFEEKHSHARYLKLPLQELVRCDTLVIVDDEITTGNTIVNLVHEYLRINPGLRDIYAVSILNWMDKNALQRFKDYGIQPVWLMHGELRTMEGEVPKKTTGTNAPYRKYGAIRYVQNDYTYFTDNTYLTQDSFGTLDTSLLKTGIYAEDLGKFDKRGKSLISVEDFHRQNHEKDTLILCGGENIPDAIEVYKYTTGYIQSVTRSPITTQRYGIIRNSIKFWNPVAECWMYLYNYDKKYDSCIVLESNEFKAEWLGKDLQKFSKYFRNGITVVSTTNLARNTLK